MLNRKVAIIGSGPAGLTSAVYTARADLEPIVFEGIQPGGQLTITTDVENYPGFPNGIQGPDLMNAFRDQAVRFGAETLFENIDSVDLSKRPFKLFSGDKEYFAESIIISTGATAKLLGLDSETKLMGHGVSACATCDAFFYKDKYVLVVGGGDSAMEEATYLTKFASRVSIVHRRDEFRASKIMVDRAMSNPKIDVMWNSEIVDMLGDPSSGGLNAAIVRNLKDGTDLSIKCDGLFLAIGHMPNSTLFKGQLDLDEKGYIVTIPGSSKTSIEGVFAAGDIQDPIYRQAITAAGSGCMAALDAEHFLSML